jgi:O-antigen ligase
MPLNSAAVGKKLVLMLWQSVKQNPLAAVFGGFFLCLPLMTWSHSTIPIELSKVLYLYGFTWLLFCIWCFKRIMRVRLGKVSPGIFTTILVLLTLAVLSSVRAGSFLESFLGNPSRLDGLLTLFHLALFSFCVATLLTPRAFKFSLYGIAAGAILIALPNFLLGAARLFGLFPTLFWEGAVGIGFGNPNLLAGYLLVTLPMVWQISSSRLALWARWGIMLLILLTLLATHSQIAVIGVVLWVAAHWSFSIRNFAKKSRLIQSAVFLLAILSIMTIWSYAPPEQGFVAESRLRIWNKLLLAVQDRPLFGHGFSQVAVAFDSTTWPPDVVFQHDVYLDKAHSSILEHFVALGFFGGISYIFQITLGWLRITKLLLLQPVPPHLLVLASGYFLLIWHLQTNVVSIAEELLFWFYIGVAAKSDLPVRDLKSFSFQSYLQHGHTKPKPHTTNSSGSSSRASRSIGKPFA